MTCNILMTKLYHNPVAKDKTNRKLKVERVSMPSITYLTDCVKQVDLHSSAK